MDKRQLRYNLACYAADAKIDPDFKISGQIVIDMIEYLDSQKPVKPNLVQIEGYGFPYYRCFCPKCGNHVGYVVNFKVVGVGMGYEKFCSNCGQEMDWNEFI